MQKLTFQIDILWKMEAFNFVNQAKTFYAVCPSFQHDALTHGHQSIWSRLEIIGRRAAWACFHLEASFACCHFVQRILMTLPSSLSLSLSLAPFFKTRNLISTKSSFARITLKRIHRYSTFGPTQVGCSIEKLGSEITIAETALTTTWRLITF